MMYAIGMKESMLMIPVEKPMPGRKVREQMPSSINRPPLIFLMRSVFMYILLCNCAYSIPEKD